MAISMLKIRRPLGRLIFNMGIALHGKTVFLIETAPCSFGVTIAAFSLASILELMYSTQIIIGGRMNYGQVIIGGRMNYGYNGIRYPRFNCICTVYSIKLAR